MNKELRGYITSLMQAAYSRNVKMVVDLLAIDTNLNVKLEQSNTVIMWAACYEHLDINQMLIDEQANLGIRNDKKCLCLIK